MKKLCGISLILAMFASLLPAGVFAQEDEGNEGDTAAVANTPTSAWPIKFESGRNSYVVYQPQFDKWDNNRLEGRSAVAVTKAGADSPEFGVVWLSAQTQASAGTVTIRDLSVTKAEFPTDSGGSADLVAALRQQLGAKTWQVAQERLQNDIEIDKVASRSAAQPVQNDVPQILFSQQPAILVPIDGVPAMRDVPGTGLKRIVNTRALMLFDPVLTNYYLYVSDHWMEAQKFEGPWTRVANPPAQLEPAREVAMKDNQVDLLGPDEEEGPMPGSPAIYVSTTPTELLQTEGPPQYSPVENTRLLYVTNSPNRIFLDTSTQAHYVLISGRWFRARNLGPKSWEYVSAASLPGDFARIPSTHPTESVRAAVAGTPQAREAAIENTVPQVATVTRSAASLSVTYDGNPLFQPIDGTSLQQAVNAPIPVIRLSENSFYALDNGVWFVAASPFGPWSAATSVPAVVYSIPRSSPLHYVTYVRIYDATPDVVYVGYTPGYVGSYISSDFVVVYGTGWHYRPWIGSVWYSAPLTWGFGFSFVHTWWYPWHSHFAVWGSPAPYFRPAWGPWYYRPVYRDGVTVINNVAINNVTINQVNVGNIYNRWDRRAVVVNRDVQPPRPQHAGAPGPGRGYITRQDGSRQVFGDGGQRGDGPDRERSAPRRHDGNPPNARRADDAARPDRPDRSDRTQSRNELPPIQGPNRRWEREQEGTGRRADRDRPSGRADGADRNSLPDFSDRAQARRELPPIQGQNRRWDRDQNAQRDRDGTSGQRRDVLRSPQQQPQAGMAPRMRDDDRRDNIRRDNNRQGQIQPGGQDRPNVVAPDRRQTVRPDDRGNVSPDRREMARSERRDATPDRQVMQERRDSARQERRDFDSRPQSQGAPQVQAMPRPQPAPQVQAMPRPQATPQRMPENRAAAPESRPRGERNTEARAARSEGRQRGDGGGGGGGGRREAGGGNFRPDAR